MKSVNSIRFLLILIGIVLFNLQANAQNSSDKLKKEQDKLEKKISNTRSLLSKTKTNTEASLNELKIIENQINYRENLLRNFDNQIRGAELKLSEKGNQIKTLRKKLFKLKEQYRRLLYYAYKHRNKYGKMMYIFSSNSYYQALKRNKYLKKIGDIQQKQFLIIKQYESLIKTEISSIENEKKYKLSMLDEKKKEKEEIEKDKEKKQVVYQKFKNEESKLMSQLRDDERKKEILKEKINAAIRKEIANAEKKARLAAEKAEKAKKKAELATNQSNSTTTEVKKEVSSTPVKKEVNYTENTKEAVSLSKNFEANKGKLPWPVEKGTITEGFGKNAHPTLENVYTNNNGIDISTPQNAQVRAVFDGEVTSVLNILGAGKVVIIKHGNYRTVYSNLQDTYVTVGSKVTTKQVIGSLTVPSGSSVSIAHFEIHVVNGGSVQCVNPSLWVNR
ncbi:MAG: peptidoglycan DD-metalloendopeptidase family protein [Flavobacteriia bacterium]|nr:peptidoglycan DD-metalloendopeptidase family protein [Flavobacteriia bacterium]